MKIVFFTLLLSVIMPETLYDFKIKEINGKMFDLTKLKGKKVLIVNTASECGYTPQYKGLEELYKRYAGKLVIIAFPANNFGEQEPGNNTEIKSFCTKNYGVTFPVSTKISVKGPDIAPLFAWMIEQPNPDFIGPIKWNFEKFLFDENGTLIRRYRSKVEPLSEEILRELK